MAAKTIYESPSITDTIVIPILTPDVNDCFLSNPYMVNNVTIYYVERDFSRGNVTEFANVQKDELAERAAIEAKNTACTTPTLDNINFAKQLRAKADSMQTSQQIYYNEAVPVAVIGNARFPAWLSTDTANAFLEHITLDDNNNTIFGNFQYTWNPLGMREGNYFVCWTWTPMPAGETMSANLSFSLAGNTGVTTSIPSHFTPPEKYDVLLERYLPEMYKDPLSDFDLSPQVLALFNNSIAGGFTTLENLANQIIDIQDANATHEAFLGLLARTFGLSLRSDDPTRWRKQIKQAIPLYKKKGTLAGLQEAFDLSGMKLTRLVRMWQVISPYTWVDDYKIETAGDHTFVLSKAALTLDPPNFEASVRYKNAAHYTVINNSNIAITTDSGISTLTVSNVAFGVGDRFKVLYKYASIPNPTQQDIEDYIRLLPLEDQRDETLQDYPPKNWNVRVLEEDDPLFSILIPVKNPFHDFLVFGKIRTEFPYSENVYNMEEYNGSIRESKEPCHIDKDFIDPCSQCLGSKYNIVVQVENLSDDRVFEAQHIIQEYLPFHAVPNAINFSGSVNDFVQPPVETIECLILYRGSETVLSGEGQMVFNRAMIDNGMPLTEVFRNTLATSSPVGSGTGTAYNNRVMLFTPEVALGRIGISKTPSETVMEIFGPHAHAGRYTLTNPVSHAAQINGSISPTAALSEPINQAAFSFSLSNITYTNTTTAIAPNNIYTLKDAAWDLNEIGAKTQWDFDFGGYAGAIWTIQLPAYSMTKLPIQNTTPNGSLLINHNNSLPAINTNNVAYVIYRPDNSVAHTGNLTLTVDVRGLVTVTDGVLTDIRPLAKVGGNYFLRYNDTGIQYEITEILDSNKFYIKSWSGGSVGGKSVEIHQRLVDTQYGLLTYEGISIQTPTNYESTLQISNGQNPVPVPLENSRFKENFLISINDGSGAELFGVADINGSTITLSGNTHYWKRLSVGGTSVSYQIFQYQTVPVTVDGVGFQRIDRRGAEVISSTTEAPAAFAMAAAPSGPEFVDTVRQEEKITFRIQYKDGTTEEGAI